ncbi:hypothetical protein ACIBI9_47080 [Nonomuraea sp. NPDC050451]|uniref:hypothetical protein n=1 Tax=Nonomuraea sp. NPDC050451 TaxID=3364364 RepID=UPI00379DE8D2
MRSGVLVWGGAGLGVAALVGLGVYFARVGLDDADKLASVIGVFVAVAGLGRRPGGCSPTGDPAAPRARHRSWRSPRRGPARRVRTAGTTSRSPATSSTVT